MYIFIIIDKFILIMNVKLKVLTIFISALILISCSKNKPESEIHTKDSKEKKTKEKTPDNDSASNLSRYDLSSENPKILTLPPELKEISGMTMTPDGRLYAEQDESGIIYQVDPGNGEIVKKFYLGKPPVKKDFEDIAYANDKFYLLHSKGEIYECSEGSDGETVVFKIYKTELNGKNDIEGMCYDKETNSLLLACKGDPGIENDENDKAVYSFSLDNMTFDPKPRFILKRSEIKSYFNPSGIQRDPLTGTFFIIAANGNEIIEISKVGNLMGKHGLPKKIHVQPEGIAFSSDGTLFISNEGKSGSGTIVVYPLKK